MRPKIEVISENNISQEWWSPVAPFLKATQDRIYQGEVDLAYNELDLELARLYYGNTIGMYELHIIDNISGRRQTGSRYIDGYVLSTNLLSMAPFFIDECSVALAGQWL